MVALSARCDQLTAYIDAELDAADAEAFARHLARCRRCRAAMHEALQLVALEAAARFLRAFVRPSSPPR